MSDPRLSQGQSPTANTVHIGPLSLVFSYATLVAFRDEDGWHVSQNVWSTTTGKHINQETPLTAERLDYDVFQEHVKQLQKRLEAM